MADIFTIKERSRLMSRIRARGNRDTELKMVALFREYGVTGWRRNAHVFGKPDFIFPRKKLAVFVDGCFWHRHKGCKFSYTPKTRAEFWLPKFEQNVARDQVVTRTLRSQGWQVVRVWECSLTRRNLARTAKQLKRKIDQISESVGDRQPRVSQERKTRAT